MHDFRLSLVALSTSDRLSFEDRAGPRVLLLRDRAFLASSALRALGERVTIFKSEVNAPYTNYSSD